MSKPIKVDNVNVTQINHEKLKIKKNEKTKKETKQCRINYNGGDFRVIIPKSKLPFGLTVGQDNEGETPSSYKKYSFEVNIDDAEFKKVLEQIDEKNVNYISECSKEWWGKPYTPEAVRDHTYSSLVKKDKKGEYPDRFKFKLPFYNGEPKFTVFNQNKEKVNIYKKNANGEIEMDWSWVQKQMHLEAVIECEGLWVVNKNVYCTWKVVQLKIYPIESNDVNYFDDEDLQEKKEDSVDEDSVDEDSVDEE